MKTLTKTLFATVFTGIVLTSSAMTTFAAGNGNNREISVSAAIPQTSVNGVNRIWASGNVKVVLTQNEKEGIIAGENFNTETTFIQRKGNTLYINSVESGQVTINVSIKDLQRIEAAGSATVVTSNNFDVKYLQVFLSQAAKAKLSAMSGSLYTVVSDDATLKMSGSTHQHTLIASNMKNVKLDSFVSLRTSSKVADYAAIRSNKLIANKLN
ncbi:GIN domain-containing protein [Pedobacter psychroterrae]|uniref:Putative auto-transporter adhesin head GIN domain-containing protein n=1 Tax=Pedobacter psychroterrae TaxID=2530453 RepID=A0A4R0NVX4_9SPHI|nr:DUF2807 domain-containing protein [Pedobacter psychroterrae]TCD03735.1 hypothetical protein EZ437_07220 [Pedobacter psychroterrae]